ncbi:MAG: hypothetical protein ACXW05_02230 [Gemmatirosa sp.]
MRLVPLVLWAAATALTTRLLGWWSVPLVAALMVVLGTALGPRMEARLGRSTAGGAAAAAALAWAALLAWDAAGPGFGAVRGILARLFELPWAAVLAATLALPAMLAWCAAAVAEGAMALWHPAHADRAAAESIVLAPPTDAVDGEALGLDEQRRTATLS